MRWEAGDIEGESGYADSISGRAGFSNGSNKTLELSGSGQPLAMLDTIIQPGPLGSFVDTGISNLATGLIHNSRLSSKPGRYIFESRDGKFPGVLNVNAGEDRNISPTATSFTLNGSASDEAGNTAGVTVHWTVDESTNSVSFSNPNIRNPVVSIPAGTTGKLRLTATSVADPSIIAADVMEFY